MCQDTAKLENVMLLSWLTKLVGNHLLIQKTFHLLTKKHQFATVYFLYEKIFKLKRRVTVPYMNSSVQSENMACPSQGRV